MKDKFEYAHQIGTFEYMPHTFLNIDTNTFGDSYFPNGEEHPFLRLKKEAMNKNNTSEDRMQAIRYMCYIPYEDFISHCIEASKTIIEENEYDVYNRFYFFSNNAKYTKLDGHIVHALHPFFFNLSLKHKYPIELTLMSARYIISQYEYTSKERNDVLEYILDIADDVNETVYARSECADILTSVGEGDEITFGYQVLEDLGDLYNENKLKTIYTNAQNAHNETINENTRNIVKSLYKEYITKYTYNDLISSSIEPIQKDLINICNEEDKELITSFLYRVMTDPFKFERLTLADVLNLVYYKIKTMLDNKDELIKRLLEEVKECDNTCTTGYFTRIVNTLNGFMTQKELTFYINPRDEIRSVIFARLNNSIRNLKERDRNAVLDSLEEGDLNAFEEFMEIYSPEEQIREEYKELLTDDEFKNIFDKCLKEFTGK